MPLAILLLLFFFASCAHRINADARLIPIEERAHFVGDHIDRLRDS